MTTSTKEVRLDKNVWLNSFKTLGKILLMAIFVVFYLISALFFLAPKFDAKIFNFLGLVKAEESCYIRQYENTGENGDLYNLILFEQEHKQYQQELDYINILISKKDYKEFCEKLDISSIYNAGSKSMYVYVGDVNSYLVNRKIKCIYALKESGEDKIPSLEIEVLNSLKDGEVTEYAFATYIDLIKDKSTTTASTYKVLLDTFVLGSDNVADLLDARIGQIQTQLAKSEISGTISEVLLEYSLMRLSYAGYVAYNKIGENTEKINEYKTIYESASSAYINLIK